METTNTETKNNPKGMIIASWVMIGVTCLAAMVPGIGFATWLIAAPVLLVTFILGIIALTKGATLQGILILLASLIAVPTFIMIAPLVTTGAAVAASEAVNESNSSYSASSSSSSAGTSNSAPAQKFAIGDTVELNDSSWVVIEARDMGSRLSGGMFSEAKQSEGKFIYVRYKVTNNTNEEQSVLFTPAVQDSKGRRFEEMDDLEFYLPEGQTGMTMEQLPSGLPKTFSAIFEVPADASGISFLTRNFDAWSKSEKSVELGF